MTFACHGEDWPDIDREVKVNHVRGFCQLPGGICDVGHCLEDLTRDGWL